MSSMIIVEEESDLFVIEAMEDQVILESEGMQEDGDFTQSVIPLSSIMEQCSICGTHYEIPRHAFLQPDLNGIVCELLDISPQSVPNAAAYFSQYMSVCTDCTKKLKKFEKLRVEMETLRHSVASSVVNTLVHIRPLDNSLLHTLKNRILAKWMTRNARGDIVINSSPAPFHMLSNRSKKVKGKNTVLPKTPPAGLVELRQCEDQLNKMNKSHTVPLPTTLRTPTLKSDGGNSWTADDLSIVAESEYEAQEILAAYMSGNIIQAEVGEVEPEHEHTDPFPDPNTSVTISFNNDTDDMDVQQEVRGNVKLKTRLRATKIKTKVKAKRKVAFQRLPQHAKSPFFCEKCGRVYSKLTTLRIHTKTCEEHPNESAVMTCPIPVCKNSFSTWLDLKFHFDETHPNSPLDKCRFCKKDFLPSSLEGHTCVRNLSNETPVMKSFACDYCERIYYKYTSLTEHVRRNHPDEKKFDCSICRKQFVSKDAMLSHEKVHPIIPEGKRAHRCSVCGIVCTTAWGLREHTKLHTGVRPYTCEICGQTFRLQNIRRNHMVVHTKERNFVCDICGRKYSLYATMYRHWKKCRLPSSPKKGRWCPICLSNGILFQKLIPLKEHMMKKHPGTKEQLNICKEAGSREFGFEAATDAALKTKQQRKGGPMIVKDLKVFGSEEGADDYSLHEDEFTTPKVVRTESLSEVSNAQSQRPSKLIEKIEDGKLRRSFRQRKTNSRLINLIKQKTHDPQHQNLKSSNQHNKLKRENE